MSAAGLAELRSNLLHTGALDRSSFRAVRWEVGGFRDEQEQGVLEQLRQDVLEGRFEVPPELEQSFSPAAFASMRGRRAGRLFLCIAGGSRRGRPLAIEIPAWQYEHAGWLIACLTEHGRGGYPEPGYPPELLAAHQAARISPIEREALSRAFLRRLASERPELRERLLASHLTGQGLVLDPTLAEGDSP